MSIYDNKAAFLKENKISLEKVWLLLCGNICMFIVFNGRFEAFLTTIMHDASNGD